MGANAQRIFGGFAAALGDKTVDWCQQAVLEHLPQYASDPQSIALEADDRQLDTYPGEPTANIAARAPYWLEIHKFRGRGLGLLLGLHFAGFDGAVIVQQNGRALQLTLPLPTFSGNWDPTPNLVVTACSQLGVGLTSSVKPPTVSSPGRSIPAGTPWWEFDSNTDFCSRFAILFPGTLPSYFLTTGRATFTGASSAALTWNNAFPSSSYCIGIGPAVITDGGGGVTINADGTTQTASGITLNASAAFTGYVDCMAWQVGSNPFADLHPADLQRLQNVIAKWRPAKATCVGVYALVAGKFMAWPVQNQGANTMGPYSIATFQGA
jgi:hypothetical protein